MIKKVRTYLFYLLLLLLPTQLGRHFFFDFSLLSGIRSDYLAPTVYLTDVIIFLIIILTIIMTLKQVQGQHDIKPLGVFLFLFLCYLLFNILVVALNKWAAFYKLFKIIEFVLLGIVIVKIKPRIQHVIYTLSIGVIYSSFIAVFQFWQQKSIGSLLYWLGERTFTAFSPGIAAYSIGGRLILRPYATFPHPNVLGGFLAVMLPVILFYIFQNRKGLDYLNTLWFVIVLLSGFTALIISFSKLAWLAVFVGMSCVFVMKSDRVRNTAKKYQRLFFLFILLLMIFSVVVLFLIQLGWENWTERLNLVKGALNVIVNNPFFGVGLNNSTIRLKEFIPSSFGLYIFQPVHNVYLLILTEVGLVGFSMLMIVLTILYRKILSADKIAVIAISQLLLIGMFDHYLWTLQQGQLMAVLFISLALIPRNALN